MALPTEVVIHLRPIKGVGNAVEQIQELIQELPAAVLRGTEVVDQSQFLVVRDIAPMYEDEEAGCPPF